MRPRAGLVAAFLALAVAGCGGNGDDGDAPAGRAAATTSAPKSCKPVDAPAPRSAARGKPPAGELDDARRYELVVRTNCGDFTVRLDLRAAPKTSASIVSLARADYFDDTLFHRIVPGFVIQGGDPTASGSGGPGYSTVDRPPAGTRYTRGVVAMAKTATEAPGTSGSQFFVVTAADAQLQPHYAVLGRVVKGLDVVLRIGRLGDPATEQPTQPVVIRDVAVRESPDK